MQDEDVYNLSLNKEKRKEKKLEFWAGEVKSDALEVATRQVEPRDGVGTNF
jgi:hypothetical protein